MASTDMRMYENRWLPFHTASHQQPCSAASLSQHWGSLPTAASFACLYGWL